MSAESAVGGGSHPPEPRRTRIDRLVQWAFGQRRAYRAAHHGREITYQELHAALNAAVGAADPALPAYDRVPSFSALYRAVANAVERGAEAAYRGAGTSHPAGDAPGGGSSAAHDAAPPPAAEDAATDASSGDVPDGLATVFDAESGCTPHPLGAGALLVEDDEVADEGPADGAPGPRGPSDARARPGVPGSARRSPGAVAHAAPDVRGVGSAARASTPTAATTTAGRTGVREPDGNHPPLALRPPVAPDAPVFVARGAVTADGLARAWGELAASAPRPALGEMIDEADPTRELGEFREGLLTPVRNGAMTPDACAAHWRRLANGTATKLEKLLYRQIPEQHRKRCLKLTGRTLRYWLAKIRDEHADAAARGEPPRPTWQVLAHDYPTDHARRRVVAPGVVRGVRDLWLEHKGDWSAAFVAREGKRVFGWDVTEREAQEIVRQIATRDRAAAEGGPTALDELFRLRVLREAAAPMDVWIMDHTFLKQEVVDPDRPEDAGAARDVDLECDAAVDRRYPGGRVVRRRATRLHLTLIQDAFTRRVLAIRLWDHTPTTRETLLVLRDAILRFGVPRVLYTDNGGDFRSHAMAVLLQAVGIQQVLSLPYSPRGRGRIERLFRKLKEMVMPGIRGYYGGRHGATWDDADLDSLEQVEDAIWRGIAALHNHAEIRRWKRSPVDRWNAYPTARTLVNPATDPHLQVALLKLLLVERDCVRQQFGLEVRGRIYLGLGLRQVPVGGTVQAFHDVGPGREDVIHLAVTTAGGGVESIGPAEFYDEEHPVGDIADLVRLEDVWVAERDAARDARQARTDALGRSAARRGAGEAMAAGMVDEVGAELARLLVAPPQRLALTAGPTPGIPEGAPDNPTPGEARLEGTPTAVPRQGPAGHGGGVRTLEPPAAVAPTARPPSARSAPERPRHGPPRPATRPAGTHARPTVTVRTWDP